MRKVLLFLALFLALMTATAAEVSEEARLTAMLNEFLAGASINDASAHERFWDEDLVYTSSRGLRFGRAKILEEMAAASDAGSEEPEVIYSAEDIRIRQYGETAVVAFRLLGSAQDGSGDMSEYLNTGTFVKREGEWKAVAWQATVIPEPEQEVTE